MRTNTWISVKESLPSHNYTVVVWVTKSPIHFGEDYLSTGSYIDDHWVECFKDVNDKAIDCQIKVSHWMHVEAPK